MNGESRPEAALDNSAGGRVHTQDTGSDATARFRNAYAVLVRGKSVRRHHLYLSIAAAERTLNRAHDRGDQADMVLVQLVPIDHRNLDKTLRRTTGTDDALRSLDDVGIADTTEAVIGDD